MWGRLAAGGGLATRPSAAIISPIRPSGQSPINFVVMCKFSTGVQRNFAKGRNRARNSPIFSSISPGRSIAVNSRMRIQCSGILTSLESTLMKKILPVPMVFAISLWAADFWQSKPYTEWSDKEVQKILSNSPWSKEVVVSLGSAGGGGSGKGSRKGGGGGGGGDTGFDGPAMGSGGGNAGGRGIQEVGGGTPVGGTPGMTLLVSWRTALPLRQAIAKQKFGAEAGTSPDAKKVIEEPQKYYVIVVSGIPGRMGRGSAEMKEALMKNSSLAIKGKEPIAPEDIQSGGTTAVFLFPKTVAIDMDDKEVEFSTKLGQQIVKTKFRLKDMVFNGKLDL
jgi:hypothetical protein